MGSSYSQLFIEGYTNWRKLINENDQGVTIIRFVNIINKIILCFKEPFLVITEFCARGNLKHLLRKSRIPLENDGSGESSQYENIFSTLCHRKLLQISVDIANGMQHLASHQVYTL